MSDLAQLTITALSIYPIKSLGAVSLERMPFDALGPMYDRRYMLVDSSGQFITQRQFPALSQVQVNANNSLDLSQGFTVLIPDSQGSNSFHSIALNAQGVMDSSLAVGVEVWSDKLVVYEQKHELAAYLSAYIGQAIKLVYIASEGALQDREVDPRFTQESRLVGFADGFPSLVCYQASLDAMNALLVQKITMQRFRPNIVVDVIDDEQGNKPRAFAENNWQRLYNKTLQLNLVKPCTRCVVPTIDPKSSERQPAVWQVLKQLNSIAGDLVFGQNALHGFMDAGSGAITYTGSLSLGDKLAIAV